MASPDTAQLKLNKEESSPDKKNAPDLYCKVCVSGKNLTVEIIEAIVDSVHSAFYKANSSMDPLPKPIKEVEVAEVMMFRKEAIASEY